MVATKNHALDIASMWLKKLKKPATDPKVTSSNLVRRAIANTGFSRNSKAHFLYLSGPAARIKRKRQLARTYTAPTTALKLFPVIR